MARLLAMFEEQQREVTTQQESLMRMERLFMELITGRLWRTLQAVGGIVKAVLPGERKRNVTLAVPAKEQSALSAYERWVEDFERPESQLIELKVSTFEVQPKISLVMPICRPKRTELMAAIDSVVRQSYPHWELCVCGDTTSDPAIREVLEAYAASDARIRVRPANERTTTGDFIAQLNETDELAPHALAYVCDAINRNAEADFLYSDEDQIDGRRQRFDPFFKPDWSPDLLLSQNYIGHLLVLRRDLAGKAGR